MRPSEVAQALRKIADRIDASKQPYASAVKEKLEEVVGSINRKVADTDSRTLGAIAHAIIAELIETNLRETDVLEEWFMEEHGLTPGDAKYVKSLLTKIMKEHERKAGKFRGALGSRW